MNSGQKNFKYISGFTIVELLIVVVVIAILAAITIVSYAGITNRATDTAVQADVKNLGTIIGMIHADTGTYPSGTGGGTAPSGVTGVKVSKNMYDASTNNLYYCATDTGFAVGARAKTGKMWAYYSNGGVKEYTGSWSNSGTICPGMLGTSTFTFSYGQTSSGSWFSWIGN